jgi:hypothetical protein
MSKEELKNKAEQAWVGCDGCSQDDKQMWINGYLAGALSNQNELPTHNEDELLNYPYPDKLLDEDGYPTEAALNYIKNWSCGFVNGTYVLGKYYKNLDFTDLIEYIQSIWYYDDAVVYEDGLLEIHTLGWSGNEEVIHVLRNTTLWMMRHKATQSGGHYYFRIDKDSEYTWGVEKVKALF